MSPHITLERNRTGWYATFTDVSGMPEGVRLPLPFTSLAQRTTLRTWRNQRFPGATILWTAGTENNA